MRNDGTKMDKNKQLREKAEKLVLTGDALLSVNYDTLTNAGKARVIHELRVHQIELQMQNEELRRTQEELEASQRKYFGLYNLSPVGFVTLDVEGIITEANLL